MSIGKQMFQFQESKLLNEIAGLPNLLKARDLYNGKRFMNVPGAATPREAVVFKTTGICKPGVLSPDFAKALARAAMVEEGIACGAYGWNTEVCIGEWRCNPVFTKEGGDASVGELLNLAFVSGTGRFAGDQGGRSVNAAAIGFAPFLFTLWGFFLEKCDGFKDAFDDYCGKANDPNTLVEAQMAACRMAAIAREALTNDVIAADLPTSANMRQLTAPQRASQRFVPEHQSGAFTSFQGNGTTATRLKKFRSVKKFIGAFANPKRTLTEEEQALVPDISSGYVLPKEIVTVCQMIESTRETVRPMNNIMLRGDPSVGKTAGARAMAASLNLPYTFVTCNAGTEIYNLVGDMMPEDSSEDTGKSINEEMFADMPSATDISMDPAASYQAITGTEKPDATEAECFTELFRAMMKRCAAACSSGFRYVESPLVKAIRNGWVCEIQEPSLIQRPAVMPGLNGLLDETGCIVLPTGEMLHRHPDCVIVSTLNVDLEGCRPLNQAFLDRHHIIMDLVCPDDKIIVERIKKMTGCDDTINLQAMIDTMRQIAKVAASRGATDGNTNSMRQLASWVEAVMVTGDYKASAEWTIISGTTADPEVRAELANVVKNRAF